MASELLNSARSGWACELHGRREHANGVRAAGKRERRIAFSESIASQPARRYTENRADSDEIQGKSLFPHGRKQ
jgi:hypothetical protein